MLIPTTISKFGVVTLGAIVAALLFVAADTSPYTPWILGGLIPIGLFIATMLVYSHRQRTKQHEETSRRLVTLETQMSPFWASLQTKVAEALHHPHPEAAEKDLLLEKLELLTITGSERERLKNLLSELANSPQTSTDEKAKAEVLLVTMPLVTEERESSAAAAAAAAAVVPTKPLTSKLR